MTWCGLPPLWMRRSLLSQSNHEPAIKSKRGESRRNSHTDFTETSVKGKVTHLQLSLLTGTQNYIFCCGVDATDWIKCSDLDKMEPFITRPMQGNGIRGCLWIYEEFCRNWSQVRLEPGLLLLGTVWGLYGSLKKHAESYKIASSGV